MIQYDAILFDLDGTLLDTLEDLTDSLNVILVKYGLPQRTYREVRGFLGYGAARLVARAVPEGETHPNFRQILTEYRAYYQAHSNQKTRLYPGVAELLPTLSRQGRKLAIISNKPNESVEALTLSYFQKLVSIAVGDACKPNPNIVLSVMSRLGTKPDSTLYVGDSEVDIATAKNAGIACAAVTWGFRDRMDLEPLAPDYLLDTPAEIMQILK